MVKTCKTCGIEKPLFVFHRYTVKGVTRYRNQCESCIKEFPPLPRNLAKPFLDEASGEWMKRCGVCRIAKPVAQFGQNKGKPQSKCKECQAAYQLRYKDDPRYREKRLARVAEYRRKRWAAMTPEEKQAYREKYFYTEKYRAKAREYVRNMSPEKRRELNEKYRGRYNEQRAATWKAKPLEVRREKMRKDMKRNRPLRRARLHNALVERVGRDDILARDGNRCYLWCKRELALNEITLDHVVPLSRDGLHEAKNLRIACQSCNSRKGTKLLSELEGLEMIGRAA